MYINWIICLYYLSCMWPKTIPLHSVRPRHAKSLDAHTLGSSATDICVFLLWKTNKKLKEETKLWRERLFCFIYIYKNTDLKGSCVLAFSESNVNIKLGCGVVTGTQVACATPNVQLLSAQDPPGAPEDPMSALWWLSVSGQYHMPWHFPPPSLAIP